MPTTYVTFDTRTGRILSVHHGAADEKEALRVAQYAMPSLGQRETKSSDKKLGVISVPSEALSAGYLYKVDVKRKTLVQTKGKNGVGFGFGVTGRSSGSSTTRGSTRVRQ